MNWQPNKPTEPGVYLLNNPATPWPHGVEKVRVFIKQARGEKLCVRRLHHTAQLMANVPEEFHWLGPIPQDTLE